MRLADHFQTLLAGAVAHPEQRLSDLPLLTESERHQLVSEWNYSTIDPLKGERVHELIAAWARANPDSIAAVCGEEQISYGQLNQKANQLAHYLQSVGVGPEEIVAVWIERSIEMIVAMLSILKAGGAYLPLDISTPRQRLAFMLSDAGAKVILTQQRLVDRLPDQLPRLIRLDSEWTTIADQSGSDLVAEFPRERLAYVIYTSGSSGMPKGVAVSHAGLINLVSWHLQTYDVTSADRATQIASASFDASVWELWPYLAAGASVHIVDDETRGDPLKLARSLDAEEITMSFLPTSLAEVALKQTWR
jgi:non-ribosomal peptide synthetase component F